MVTYHACVFPVELALRQSCEEDIGDCCDYHEARDVQASVSAAVGTIGCNEHEGESDGVWRHCHEIGARCGLVAQVLDDSW